LDAVLLYQLVSLYQFEQDWPLSQEIKPLLRAAWIVNSPQLSIPRSLVEFRQEVRNPFPFLSIYLKLPGTQDMHHQE
jgi:hypothetical protein